MPLALIKEKLQETIDYKSRQKPLSKKNSVNQMECNPNDAPIQTPEPIIKQTDQKHSKPKLSKTRRNIIVSKNKPYMGYDDYFSP